MFDMSVWPACLDCRWREFEEARGGYCPRCGARVVDES